MKTFTQYLTEFDAPNIYCDMDGVLADFVSFTTKYLGKSAEEMLILLKVRLENDPAAELLIAVKEQNKITHLRLENILSQ